MSAPAETASTPAGAAPSPPPRPRPVGALAGRLLAWLRDPNPILVKELRATFRTVLFIRFLYLSTGVVGLIVLSGGAMVAAGNVPPSDVGKVVFQLFFSVALFVIALVAPAYAATLFTGEKEQRTYESLVLSGMPPHRIVRGKFVAAYASITLVMVALLPVVGIAFLFGGVSPWHIVFGYAWLQLVLAPAIAMGLAISARLASTRIAIVLATIVFMPTALVATGVVTALGDLAKRYWGTGMQGPFWFADALSVRFFEWDTFLLLVVVPLWVFVVPTWFFLATAVAAVRPPAEDRSTPLKLWGMAASLSTLAIPAIAVALPTSTVERGQTGVVLAALAGGLLLFFALVLTDEPPLPPRLVELRRPSMSALRRALLVLGPGAAPTLRFSYLWIALTAAGMSLVPAATRWVLEPAARDHLRFDAALLVLAVGNGAAALALCGLAAYLRAMLRNGLAARVLALAVLFGAIVVPLLAQLVWDPRAFDRLDGHTPMLIRLTPISPTILAIQLAADEIPAWRAWEVLVPGVLYGLLALLFWVLVEARVRVVRQAVAAHRARQAERAREADARRAARLQARAAAEAGWPDLPLAGGDGPPTLAPPGGAGGAGTG
jgi:ABC-type transport system involved in multi-copper enzyme maturation permease subunit